LFENQIIAFIGPGIMAEAMISRLIGNQVVPSSSIRASGPRPNRMENLAATYQIETFTNNMEAVRDADIVVLAVKPQSLDKVLDELKGVIRPDALLLSIIAGASISKISRGADHSVVVRSMPNTPAQIGEGITVWTASPAVTDKQRQLARLILSAFGEEIFMEEETYLDMATALSGTGPAYVFLFMEAMVDAGVHLGFPRRIAEQLVSRTVRGSVDYYLDSPMHMTRLRNQVTSPGGTTATALYYLEKAGFRTALSRAIWAAFERSRELGADPDAHAPGE
jgi:pyrroline-5-carboxylate reductase